MKKTTTLVALGMVTLLGLAGCTEREKGSVIGGLIGGAAGSLLGKGTGKVVITGATAVLGSIIGAQIGDRLDQQQKQQVAGQMSHALEYNRDGQGQQWRDPNEDVSARTVPVRTYQTAGGEYCREFQQEIMVAGEKQQGYGTACRQPDGSWKIIS